ncbi:MAG: PAS domain-containing protein [Smithellaceae bacterium]|nr:PAS domain-containing protein [Smithellaceae bacterium]
MSESKEEWLAILHTTGLPAFILDPDHGIVAVNKAFLQIIDHPEDEVLGRKCYEIMHSADASRPPRECPMEEMIAERPLRIREKEVQTRLGTFLVSCTPVLDQQGALKRVIHVANEISAKKKTTKQSPARKGKTPAR